MTWVPIAGDGGEFADLNVQPPILPRRDSERIFVGAEVRPFIRWIEATIEPRLREEVDVRSRLNVEKYG